MKILLTDKIREADRYTIENEPISSLKLMERASSVFVKEFKELYPLTNRPVHVICGKGNNGGDGLCIARMLHRDGYELAIHVFSQDGSEDFKSSLKKVPDSITIHEIESADISLAPNSIVIDAIFGTGLDRPVEGLYAELIIALNELKLEVIAVDIPSGLFSDQSTEKGPVLNCRLCLSFQFPKLSFFFPENEDYLNDFKVLDIGLHKDFIQKVGTDYNYLDQSVALLLPKKRKFSHKGINGRGLIAGGSHGKMGAVQLSCTAALKAGIGLLTTYIPLGGYEILQIGVPESMVLTDQNDRELSESPKDLSEFDVVGIGPGMGTGASAERALTAFLNDFRKPMVIDADALNILAENRELLHLLAKNSILTPHPGEFKRLVGEWNNDTHKIKLLREAAKSWDCVIILKGAHTMICDPSGKIYINSTGNPGMATGGSGDVLTGVITALVAQGLNSLDAAVLGVYIHGLAGDFAAKKLSQYSLTARSIIDHLPKAIKSLI